MLVDGFPAGGLAANCYVIAPGRGGECVVVDPGEDAVDGLTELLETHDLRPVAVLATHGHADHIFSVAPVCGAHDVPAWIHPEDRVLLADPGRAFGEIGRELYGGLTFTEPDDVREMTDGSVLELAGLTLTVTHTPGHTRGSVVFGTDGPESPVLLSGDTLFNNGVGRTDLWGGSDADMRASLAQLLTLPDDTVVLPGHGPATTIGHERRTNPYLRAFGVDTGFPTRGL